MVHSLYSKFKHFIRDEKLFSPNDKVLLTVSGGVDSVVLAYLFHRADFNFSIAHCNFGLRGNDSDEDENFVRNLAKSLNVEVFVNRFDTKNYATANKLSIQLAARELRYHWFEEIASENNIKFIVTAHHKNDFTETVLLNLSKGSILQGLLGIPVKNGKIIRPLLFALKNEIKDYAKENNILYREDTSNKEDKYQRNLIRNQVIPLLQNINPNIIETVFQSANQRQNMADWFNLEAEKFLFDYVKTEAENQVIYIYQLPEKYFNPAFFHFWLERYCFTFPQAENLVKSLNSTEEKVFYATNHKVTKQREKIVLSTIKTNPGKEIAYITSAENTLVYFNGKSLQFNVISASEIIEYKNKNNVFFDLEKLKFPLQFRSWETGDYFIPFGLGKKKKISDFYKDIKLSKDEKDAQVLLVSAENEIVWLVALRTDERFKITETTKQVLRIAVN